MTSIIAAALVRNAIGLRNHKTIVNEWIRSFRHFRERSYDAFCKWKAYEAANNAITMTIIEDGECPDNDIFREMDAFVSSYS